MKFMLIMNTPRDGYTQYMKWPRKVLEANTERAGDSPAAMSLYRQAASKTTSVPEREYLLRKAARLQEAMG